MALVRFKRGTRAELDAAAAAKELIQGEPYYITDEDGYAIGSGQDSYIDFNIGDWDAAFSWGDHAAAGYGVLGTGSGEVRTNSQNDSRFGRLTSSNDWTGSNIFTDGGLRIIDGAWIGRFNVPTLTHNANWNLPDASGTVALTDDIPTVPDVIDELSDVTITSPTDGQILVYEKGEWVNDDAPSGGPDPAYLYVRQATTSLTSPRYVFTDGDSTIESNQGLDRIDTSVFFRPTSSSSEGKYLLSGTVIITSSGSSVYTLSVRVGTSSSFTTVYSTSQRVDSPIPAFVPLSLIVDLDTSDGVGIYVAAGMGDTPSIRSGSTMTLTKID